MVYYVYDGSFEGLLTAIYEAYYRQEEPEKILSDDNIQDNLFVQYVYINTDQQKAQRVYDAIVHKISSSAAKKVLYAFLSEAQDAGTAIYRYLKLGFKMGKSVDSALADPYVFRIHVLHKKVSQEAGKMLGLIRFRLLKNGIFYAPIEPDFNILGIIAPHFKRRMPTQDWIIHDVKRKLAAFHSQGQYAILPFEFKEALPLDDEEFDYQTLWKEYFQNIAIKSRINPRLQRQFMPVRYWKYLIEKPGTQTKS
ncbi:putative DNA metabolism protein [Caldicoprobacter guelmensis]|uniref:TIGR03915 family putative DNA repair protein n=1 Tax=Caldicoprobacter guelmensis TaxID=1170224 RepID=UPI00195AE2E5|nr:putative DNA metabolism protein [Caldicoprobacter guelmensis]